MKKIAIISFFILCVFIFSAKVFANEPSTYEIYNTLKTYIENADKTIIPNIELSKAYYFKGYILEHDWNDKDMAISDYKNALKYNQNNVKALNALARITFEMKDYQTSISYLNKLMNIEPKNEEHHRIAGHLYYAMKDYKMATNEYTKAIQLKQKNPDCFYFRGCCEIISKQTAKGMQDLDYAKRQYFELNQIDDYKKIVELINKLNTPVKSTTKRILSNYNNYYQNSDTIGNYEVIKQNEEFRKQRELEDNRIRLDQLEDKIQLMQWGIKTY